VSTTHPVNSRVYLRFNADLRGTVTFVGHKSFTVVYDGGRGTDDKKLQGGRYVYPLDRMSAFLPGNPPAS
jgi:hypothetical protein